MAIMRNRLARFRACLDRGVPGQGLTEYGLIISVVSIAAVVLIMAMGPRVASMFQTAGQSAFQSDRRRKENFAVVDPQDVLACLRSLQIERRG